MELLAAISQMLVENAAFGKSHARCVSSRFGVFQLGRALHLSGNDVAFSPDGERLASASAKNEAVKLWDVTSRHEVATLAGEGSLFERVQFSPDGTLLVAINSQGQAHLWRAPSLDEIEKLQSANR